METRRAPPHRDGVRALRPGLRIHPKRDEGWRAELLQAFEIARSGEITSAPPIPHLPEIMLHLVLKRDEQFHSREPRPAFAVMPCSPEGRQMTVTSQSHGGLRALPRAEVVCCSRASSEPGTSVDGHSLPGAAVASTSSPGGDRRWQGWLRLGPPGVGGLGGVSSDDLGGETLLRRRSSPVRAWGASRCRRSGTALDPESVLGHVLGPDINDGGGRPIEDPSRKRSAATGWCSH